ncbi:MAG: cupin domain-containing protein [Pseudomonadota bacterium]|jgi:quercetin dioxygenase-like cupin family protein
MTASVPSGLGWLAPRGVLPAVVAGLAVEMAMGSAAAPHKMAAPLSALSGIICAANAADGRDAKLHPVVTPVASHALPNAAGKRVTVVRVSYGPGGFSPPHHHSGSVTAYIVKGTIRSQLAGGPIETFKVGESFFEPPGAVHLVSENASVTEPAELLAIFVADEGAELTTYHE